MCILNGVLLKSPMFTREIFDSFLTDLSENNFLLNREEELKNYIKHKYYGRITQDLHNQFFRSLWKIVLYLDNQECNSNRKINFYALKYLIDFSHDQLLENIRKESDYYNNITLNNSMIVRYVLDVLFTYPLIYPLLNEANKIKITELCEKNMDYLFVSLFLTDSYAELFKKILESWTYKNKAEMTNSTVSETYEKLLYKGAKNNGQTESLINTYIKIYGKAISFDDADNIFEVLIGPHLDEMTIDQFKNLITEAERNNQTYSRRGARNDHRILKAKLDEKYGGTFVLDDYPSFKDSIS